MSGVAPRVGFDWHKVAWSAADATPPTHCCYCSTRIPEKTVPLIIWRGDGAAAYFCDACMSDWWGMSTISEDGR